MIPSFRLLIPTLAALAAITIPLAAAPEPQTSTSTSGLLAQTLQPFVDNHLAAGFVAIVADKNKVLDLEAVGYSSLAKKTPMKSDTLFWIASMSKSMTATAFMMLVDEGKVKVDDPVEKYLPEFKGQMVVDELDPKHVAQPADHPITIKEILSHTSGLTRPDSLTKAQIAALDNNSLEREVADHAAQPLVRQPSSKYEYNNVGIDTAGRIIEVVSGMPYADFMQKRLFDPLGMKDTTFWPTLEQGERLARTAGPNADKTDLVERDIYTSNKAGIDNLATRELGSDKIVPPAILSEGGHSPIFTYKMHYAMPAGGIYSTATDVARFCQMLLNGGVFEGKRYVSEDAIKQMTSPQTGNLYPTPSSAYGLGWDLKLSPKDLPSEGTFGHTGALRTRMWIDPRKQLVMVLLMARTELLGKDQDAIYGAFLKAAEEKYGTQTAGARERSGLSCISRQPFPAPDGTKVLSAFTADFETRALPQGWGQGMGEVVTDGDAPQGHAYFRMAAKKGAALRSPLIPAQGGAPYFLSLWMKAPLEPWMTIGFTSDERDRTFTDIHIPLYYQPQPIDSWNQWRRMGFYFWMPLQCKTIQLSISTRNESPDGFICVDDAQLRTATDAEMSAAYKNEKSNFPPYHATPQPGDGKNLALSVAKWEGRAGIPGKPFVIWALGSSFTDFQGGGYELIDAIRQRFPNAPPIIYRKHGGPGTPWEYIDGWINQFVAFEQPDLIFTYTSGTLEGLDAMLTDLRRRTTAEIIVPSLHFRPPPDAITPMNITHGMGVAWDSVREICEKHGAEFVPNREEMAAYLAQTGLDQDALLYDHNHQGMHGRIRIWDNVFAHLVKSTQPAYTPESRERAIPVNPAAHTSTEQVTLSGNWSEADGVVRTGATGAKLKVSFTGNQIDLLGRKAPGGGSIKVLIDGAPAGQAPVFVTNCIQSSKSNWRIPHEIELGKNLVPQKWTITMTSDVGDYRLEGSVAGPDGTGNLTQHFLSNSGQIGIDPRFWREGRRPKAGPDQYGNVTGEALTFNVMRGVVDELSFKADHAAPLAEPLALNLSNGQHTLELVTTGDGEVTIGGFYVYQPPEKPNP